MRAALVILFLAAAPAAARPVRLPIKPFPTSLLAGPPILPNGLLIAETDGRMRTLELDELAPLRLRWSIRF